MFRGDHGQDTATRVGHAQLLAGGIPHHGAKGQRCTLLIAQFKLYAVTDFGLESSQGNRTAGRDDLLHGVVEFGIARGVACIQADVVAAVGGGIGDDGVAVRAGLDTCVAGYAYPGYRRLYFGQHDGLAQSLTQVHPAAMRHNRTIGREVAGAVLTTIGVAGIHAGKRACCSHVDRGTAFTGSTAATCNGVTDLALGRQ